MKYTFLIIIATLLSSFAVAQDNSSISEKEAGIIFEKTKAFPVNTEFSIAFLKNGKVSYHGIKRVNDTLEHTENAHKIFEIGSITKVFTSTILANLVLENKIGLDDPIQEYFKFPLKSKQITLKQLANHTSGLPRLPANLDLETADPSNPYNEYSQDDLNEYLKNGMELDSLAGSAYAYSNVGAGVLGYVLEAQTGLRYERLLQDYVLSKYGMSNTTTHFETIDHEIVDGLDSEGKKTSHWNLNALVGAGGLLSTVEDLAKFALAQFNLQNKELKLTRETTFEIPQYRMDVGLAWNIIKPLPGVTWYMHNGGTGGYSSIMALDTTQKNGIIILSNVSSFHKNARDIDQLCLGLMKGLYEQ